MSKQILHLLLFGSLFIVGCSSEVTTVQVVRNPSIKFEYGANVFWRSSNQSVTNIARVVVYPGDTTQPAQLYSRLNLQASGRDDAGNDLQLVINFDVLNPTQLTGTYTSIYTNQRGLAQVQLYNLTNANSPVAFNLCSANVSQAIFQVQKQNTTERIMTGNFQMTLCNARDTTNKINIIKGTFTDIRY